MSRNCISICSPAMLLVKGRILSEVLKDVELQDHQPGIVDLKMCLVPVLRVCYCRYC